MKVNTDNYMVLWRGIIFIFHNLHTDFNTSLIICTSSLKLNSSASSTLKRGAVAPVSRLGAPGF